jgi:Tol biopolymer transport system component
MTSPIPDDTLRTRVALIAAISVLGIAILAMGAWAVLRPHPKAAAPRTFIPAEETSAAARPATSSVLSTAAAATDSSSTTAAAAAAATTGGEGAAPGMVRASKVAFRLGSSIYVADENGGSTKAVTQAPDGQFTLSPDGLTLALARAGTISLYEVATGRLEFSGVAEAVKPVWLPDSSAVMFMRVGADGVAQIFQVSPTGGDETVVGTGSSVAVSPNGAAIALLPALGSTATPQVIVSKNGGPFTPIAVPSGDPIGIALGNTRLYISTMGAAEGGAIWSVALDGSGARALVKPSTAADKGATFGRMLPSPDGTSLLYAAESDDGYSRMWLVPTAGGAPFSLSSRRDNYPLQWSVSGKDILFIEGNSFQGETTALYHVSPTGTRRLMIVSGAGL